MIFQWLLEVVFGTCTRHSLARCEGCGVATRNGVYCSICDSERMIDEHSLYMP